MKLYKIRDWDKIYENNRTRDLKQMAWVPVPNNHDGDGYTVLVGRKDGAAMLGAWVALVQVASKCDPRGTLLRRHGLPHDSASLSRITRLPESIFESVLIIADTECNWLISEEMQMELEIPQEGVVIPHDGAPRARAGARAQNGREWKGREWKGSSGDFLILPSDLSTDRTEAAWKEWVAHRSEIRKKITPTSAKRTIQQLRDWGPERWISAVNQAVASGWQGLFEPKAPARLQKYVPNI